MLSFLDCYSGYH
jgi:hypothetical protein